MRTVAMLANEAAEAVAQGVAAPDAIDVAMRMGVNYPRGPLAWADALGAANVRDVARESRRALRRGPVPGLAAARAARAGRGTTA